MNENISLTAFRRETFALPDPALSSDVYVQRLREWEDIAKSTGEREAEYFERAASGNFGVLPLSDLYVYANRARCALLYRAARAEHPGVSLMPRLACAAVERIDRALVAAADRAAIDEWAALPYPAFRDLNLFVLVSDNVGSLAKHRGRIEAAKLWRQARMFDDAASAADEGAKA